MNNKKKFYELGQFLGGFFHQDWAVVFNWKGQEPNFEAIVRSYVATDTAQSVNKVKEELKQLLALHLTDNQLENLVSDEFGVAYSPTRRGTTFRQWLEQILEILQEPSNPKNAMEFVGGTSPESIGLDLDALGFPRINQK
jgi:hypothetical protein